MAKILGIDYGEKRIGLALSSDDKKYAFPYDVLENKDEDLILKRLKEICQKENVDLVVLGLPLNLKGEEGGKARQVKEFARQLEKFLDLPIVFQDERFSSQAVEKSFRHFGEKLKREEIDKKAAAEILQNYLDGLDIK